MTPIESREQKTQIANLASQIEGLAGEFEDAVDEADGHLEEIEDLARMAICSSFPDDVEKLKALIRDMNDELDKIREKVTEARA